MEAVVSLQRTGPSHCLYLLYPALFKPYALVSRVCVQKVGGQEIAGKRQPPRCWFKPGSTGGSPELTPGPALLTRDAEILHLGDQ
jgi:hypothetical protein